jgi:hypothetical protein
VARLKATTSTLSEDRLRRLMLEDLDVLIQAIVDLRADLRSYQAVIERNRKHFMANGRASELAGLVKVAKVRGAFSERLTTLERARNSARQSVWRLQVAEGMTISEIARLWGFSRQLVSRALASAGSRRTGGSRSTSRVS